MKLFRGEREFIIACIIVLAIFGATYGISYLKTAHFERIDNAERQQRNKVVGIGERLLFGSEEDAVPLPSGADYSALLGKGSFAVTVEDAQAFRSTEDARAFLGEDVAFLAPDDWLSQVSGVLVVTIKFENINARNDGCEDPYEFNARSLVPDDCPGDILAFDSPVIEAKDDSSRAAHFRVAPGAELTMRIAYELRDWPPMGTYRFHLGAKERQKYRFEIPVQKVWDYEE